MDGLTKCPNPLRTLKLWHVLIGWQWAQDYWAHRDASGNRVRYWFGVATVKACDGDETALILTLHRLQVSVARVF